MISVRTARLALIGLALLLACSAPAAAPSTGNAGKPAPATDAPKEKVLNIVLVGEPRGLTTWQEATTGGVVNIHEVISNGLMASNANSEPTPRLVAEIPSIEHGTWRVLDDGTMETTYRLQPNAVWHDGSPVTSHDIAFSVRAQTDPRLDVNQSFNGGMLKGGADRVDTPDDKTVVIHWSKPFGFADSLTIRDFTPLPSAILEPVFDRSVDEFNHSPYWSDASAFVGNGPFRLASWERGVQMDLRAFDQYYLGRPKISRMIISFVGDNNAAIARVLAGDVDMAWGASWEASGMDLVRSKGIGDFVIGSEGVDHFAFQFKDMATPIDLARDVRVRQALAYALDREAINQVEADGISSPADSWVPTSDPRYKDAEPSITKYPYDPQRASALLAEAGWNRGGDGLLHNQAGQRFPCLVRGQEGKRGGDVAVDSWKAVGIDASVEARPAGLERDLEARATFKCVEESFRSMGRTGIQHLHSNNAMIPERRYAGTNRGAYMNPELDRLIDAFFAATSVPDRLQIERDMLRVRTADEPLIFTIYDLRKDFQKTGVTGIVIKTGLDIVDSRTWNVHEWDKQ